MSGRLELGWEEWLALPDLGLPAIKAKVDTGARTSALHADEIERFANEDGAAMVRFTIRPSPDRPRLKRTCEAPIVDEREITSSNGQIEQRIVIATDMVIGAVRKRIQITLTNRETMSYRMLLGRSAIGEDAIVAPTKSFLQGELDYALYTKKGQAALVDERPLRLALLTREPKNYSSQRLVEAAQAAGHTIDVINTARCYLRVDTKRPEVHYDGAALPQYDAIIPRRATNCSHINYYRAKALACHSLRLRTHPRIQRILLG